MKLRAKLIFCFLSTSVFLLLIASFGVFVTDKLSRSTKFITGDVTTTLELINQIRSAAINIREISKEQSSAAKTNDSLAAHRDANPLSDAAADLNSKVEAYHQAHENQESGQLLKLSRQAVIIAERLSAVGTARDRSLNSENQAYSKLNETISDLLSALDKGSIAQLDKVIKRSKLTEGFVSIVAELHYALLLIGAVMSYALGKLLASRLANPILRMRDATHSIGRGNLDVRIDHHSKDEIGDLAEALNSMTANLQKSTVSKEILDRIIHSMPDALFVVDNENLIQTVNASAVNLLHYSEQELLDTPFESYLEHKKNQAKQVKELPGQTSANSPPPVIEAAFLTKDRQAIPVDLTASNLESSAAKTKGAVYVAKDIRLRRRLEQERDRFKKQLRRSEQLASLGTISAIIAHKLNQPLTAVQLFINQCLRENEAKGQSELIEDNLHECLSELSRANGIIKEILYTARDSSEHPDVEVDIAEAAKQVISVLDDQLYESALSLECQGLEVLPKIHAREGEIDAVFFFLIQNAIHAAKEQNTGANARKLKISGESFDDHLVVSFLDNCGGIPEEDVDKIFEMFFTTKKKGEGTGLGLPIVRQTVNRIGGEVFVESNHGIGCNFTVKIPL